MSSARPTPLSSADRAPVARKQKQQLQQEFLAQMGAIQQFHQLFEYLPGVHFFVKDLHSRLIYASRHIFERLGLVDQLDIVGTTDHDHFPPSMADGFVRDDQQVMTTGKPLISRIETWYNEQRIQDWFVTNKLPIVDGTGNIIGLMGTMQSYEGKKKALMPYSQISAAVNHIRDNHRERITVTDLASLCRLSPRQLHRRFRDVFGMSVQEFLNRTRIQAASDALLSSGATIADIAIDFGFCDQSAFTQQFRRHTGLTPLKFRKQYAATT